MRRRGFPAQTRGAGSSLIVFEVSARLPESPRLASGLEVAAGHIVTFQRLASQQSLGCTRHTNGESSSTWSHPVVRQHHWAMCDPYCAAAFFSEMGRTTACVSKISIDKHFAHLGTEPSPW